MGARTLKLLGTTPKALGVTGALDGPPYKQAGVRVVRPDFWVVRVSLLGKPDLNALNPMWEILNAELADQAEGDVGARLRVLDAAGARGGVADVEPH